MSLAETLTWPFFHAGHREFAERLSRWAAENLHKLPHDDVDEACRARVKAMGEAGFLAPTVPAIYGGSHPQLDVRTLFDTVVSRFEWTGTHKAEFMGVPATGRQVRVWGVVIDRLEAGRIKDTRILMDALGLMMQLGTLPGSAT